MLFAGHSDGSIFVRRLERTPTGAMGVKLLRFCDPASTSTTPSRITCMSYDSPLDRLYTGDMSGLSRVVKKVSGIPFESTEVGTKAVEEGTFRCGDGRRVGSVRVCPRRVRGVAGCCSWVSVEAALRLWVAECVGRERLGGGSVRMTTEVGGGGGGTLHCSLPCLIAVPRSGSGVCCVLCSRARKGSISAGHDDSSFPTV